MVDFSLISDTYDKIHQHLVETPLLESPFLSERLNKRVFIKAECLQKTGSFKYRGSWSSFVNNDFEDLKKGVLAYSSGNHAQGIAAVANQLKIQATIIMPKDDPRLKIKNTQSYGANVVFYDRIKESREEIGEKLQKEKSLKLIRPYDDPFVIAGQGSLGIELINQAKRMKLDAADVLVCCGGGGLASGVSLALQGLSEGFKVRTCEPENFDDMARSLKQKRRVKNKAMDASLMPWIIASQTIPILAIAPMIIIILNAFGLSGLLPKALISTYLSFFPIAVGMVKGLRSPELSYLDLMHTYNSSRLNIFWKLRLPSSVPYLFASMKVAIAISLVGAIVGELPTGAVAGLGARLLTGSYFGLTIQIWSALVMAAILAGTLIFILNFISRITLKRMGVQE